MVATRSTMAELGTAAPDFALPDPAGTIHRLADFDGSAALVVMFLCNHCPYVRHIARELALVTQRLQAEGVSVVGISSNDIDAYPADAPDQMAVTARAYGFDFPYLFDESQAVAKAYRAACTPDFYVFDRDRRLAYRGQFDASRPGNGEPVTGADLKAAVDAVLAGEPVAEPQRPSIGCSIKWNPGNEPEYFA
ncbi:MAG: thioredoxin family protein [Actinobacteria bacterium]|nr:thioredoxin family protein [Actinomycetota bacterium]